MPAPNRSLPPQTKKRKTTHDSSIVADIKTLEHELTTAVQSNASLNKLADLIDLVAGKKELEPQELSKGIYALYRVFTLVIGSGKMTAAAEGAAVKAVKAWLWERLHAYTDFLVVLLSNEEKVLRTSALQILFSLQKHLSSAQTTATQRPEFHLVHFRKIVSGLLLPASEDGIIDPDVLNMFYETWFSVYDDIRWFFLRDAVSVLDKDPSTSSTKNLLSILERLQTFPTDKEELNAWWVSELGAKPPKPKNSTDEDEEDEPTPEDNEDDDDDWRKFFDEPTLDPSSKQPSKSTRLHKLSIHQSLHALPSHRAVFTRCWLALLPRISAPTDTVRVLNFMHRGVLPHLTRPILVMDWLASCVDHRGALGLLALNGLFTLMREYNLDYPSFYTRLYAFLTRDVLSSKYRARFFRLTEVFLGSTHLPAALLASFVKRLARLTLGAPPAAVVMVVPFVYNILKKHPALMVMIHRDADPGFEDPFDPSEPNPLSTRALDSSLWELWTHRNHYHATVSTLCKIFGEAFTKPGYSMEDFLDHTYATLFETEVNRKIKREPALAMEEGRVGKVDFFPVQRDEEGEETGEHQTAMDVVNELWVF